MCQAIPRQVLRVAEGRAEVVVNGRTAWVSTQALPGLAPGDYILVYAGHALERLSAAEALEILQILGELTALVEQPVRAEEGEHGG